MQWIRAHWYTALLIAAAVLFVTGGIMATRDAGNGFGPGGVENIAVEYPYYALANPTSDNAAEITRESSQNSAQNAGGSVPVVPRFGNTAPPKENPPVQTAAPAIPKATGTMPVKTQEYSLNDSYASFFQALSRILSPASTRTPEQKALFEYGNALGSVITGFENTHRDVVQTLKAFFDSRIDPAKAAGIPEIADAYAQLTAGGARTVPVSGADAAAGLRKVADAYAQLSATVANMKNVPPEAEMLNAGLANVYAGAAQGLVRLSNTDGETQLIEAIDAYNANADGFIKNYVALVQLFSAYEVKFAASDPGAVFSFSAGGSL